MKSLFYLLSTLFLLFGASPAWATAQVGDSIIINQQEELLHTNPLEPLIKERPALLPKNRMINSANWRGYIATWEVKEAALYLKRVDLKLWFTSDGSEPDYTREPPESASVEPTDYLPQMFDGAHEVKASWFSGALIVPLGEMKNYVHMGYGSTYERYTVLHVKNGDLTSSQSFSRREFEKYKRKKFLRFQKTTEYRQLLLENKNNKSPMKESVFIGFLYSYYAEQYLSVSD